MADLHLVNGIYPPSYFNLAGVQEIQYPTSIWWSSNSRYASEDENRNYLSTEYGGATTTETLEIDLGRVRQLNYLNFDVLRVPVNVKIEYDSPSSPDQRSNWVEIKPTTTLSFDNRIEFDSTTRVAWFNAEYNFTDSKGHMVHTRYLRITFSRRDEPWPTADSAPFQYPVFVSNLRLGRYVNEWKDVHGVLISSELSDIAEFTLTSQLGTTTREIRQKFRFPASVARGNITPNMTGFGVLIRADVAAGAFDTVDETPDVKYQWSLYDVTSATPVLLRTGEESKSVTLGMVWLDFYLTEDQIVAADPSSVFELRVKSLDNTRSLTVYSRAPNTLTSTTIPGTLTFTNSSTNVTTSTDTRSVVSIGDFIVKSSEPSTVYTVNNVTASAITINTAYTGTTASGQVGAKIYAMSTWNSVSGAYEADTTKNLVMRVFGDVGDEGKDVLGNTYRYAARKEKAEHVFDSTKAGWMSAPAPTPNAVESLYFDVRTLDSDDVWQLSRVDSVQIAPRTPGVRMNVYYSKQNLRGETPANEREWNMLLWTPAAHDSFILRKNAIFDLPNSINAAYIKLEFTSLNPLPYRIPHYPQLPPRKYKRFPTWIEDQFANASVKKTVNDWFARNATPVQTKVLESIADPVREFEYQQRLFMTALASGELTDSQVNSSIVDISNRSLIDPITASKVYLNTADQFRNSLLISTDRTSVLGRAVLSRYDYNLVTEPFEATYVPYLSEQVPVSSTTNERVTESYQSMATMPMRFNRTTRHEYIEEEAYFNKKAFFVGIDEVRFLRHDYTVTSDNSLYTEEYYDNDFLALNTWTSENHTTIEEGQTVYVSYKVGEEDTQIVDEPIVMNSFDMIALAVSGSPVQEVRVFSLPNRQGVEYYQEYDYELSFGESAGKRWTYIGRSALSERLTVSLQAIAFTDAGTVVGQAIILSPPTYDAGKATAIGLVSGQNAKVEPDYGAGAYGGNAATYSDMRSAYTDSVSVTAVGIVTSTDERTITDTGTATAIGKPSMTEVFTDVP